MPIHVNAERLQSAFEKARPTRRRFLAGAAAVYAELVLPARAQDVSPRKDETVWAILADTHIHRSRSRTIRGSNMARNLGAVVPEVAGADPDHVLINGDMAEKVGKPKDYVTFRELIAPLIERKTPLHFTLGNHDQRENFSAAFSSPDDSPLIEKRVSNFAVGGLRWILLDSLDRSGGFSGSLGKPQRDWLAKLLDAASAQPTIVALHHNPKRTPIGLDDADELLQLLIPRRHVKAVVFGHTHLYRHWTKEGLHFVNLPAVGYWFDPTEPLGWVLAKTREDGMTLEFRAVDSDHRRNGEIKKLDWRSG